MAPAGEHCPDGAYCLWKKTLYRGDKLVVKTNKLFTLPAFMNNKASSFKSRVGGGREVVLYAKKNGNGVSTGCIPNGTNHPDLGLWSDRVGSADVINC